MKFVRRLTSNMNEASEPPLLPLAGPVAAGRPRCPKRALVVKSRKSNRLFQVNNLASDLVDCLGEFLASKNVINRSERYAKIDEEQINVGQHVTPQVMIDLRQNNLPANDYRNRNGRNNQSRLQIKVKKFNQIGKGQAAQMKKKRNVSRLLGMLLSGHCPESRLCLVGKLLRTPMVLAALFSLSLATSLFILYTLSFHHCQSASHAHGARNGSMPRTRAILLVAISSQQQVERESALSDQLTSASRLVAGPSLARSRAHHINSRHLATAPNSKDNKSTRLFQTECGTYEARQEGGAWLLTGVAYASPPIGSRRWQKPQPIWQNDELCPKSNRRPLPGNRGPRRAPTRSNHCVQFSPFNDRVSGSEDCLYLDIYTPIGNNKSVERLPVMVYIHGGFLVFGSSNGPPEATTEEQEEEVVDHVNWMRARPSGQLAAELNVVLVAPNYRLQALGFMALRGLAEDNGPDGSEGNYGLWDQLVALEWIRRNIGSFGGNPDNVLLFGPDAASALPLALVSQQQQQQQLVPSSARSGAAAADREERAAIDLSVVADTTANVAGHSPAGLTQSPSPSPSPSPPLPFRSVWLMNPTIYYELPYELANQHYARLGWSQSACARARSGRDLPQHAQADERSLIACLMNLTGEQIVREYLGRDRPSFRLDDENSLPIRSIFPDQFVTLDGELVQDSYPFMRHTTTVAGQLSNQLEQQKSPTPPGVNLIVGSTAQAVEYWACPRNLHNWSWRDFGHYVETSLNSFNQPQASDTFKLASELYGVPGEGREQVELTTSTSLSSNNKSSPNPSPMGIYLTMVSDIRQVCPSHELARSLGQSPRVNSLERYVVEWRPSGQLSASLRMTTGDAADVGPGECPGCTPATTTAAAPAAELKREPPSSSAELPQEANHANLQYAFHYWDLLALFGFEFDAQLQPSEQDLEFQRHIRAMAKRIAWQGQQQQQQGRPGPKGSSSDRFVLFTQDNSVHKTESERLFVDGEREIEHKQRECNMWRQTLKQSYAWIS